mmetsp:Transcript_988/g.1947  ORF Transcript_988/g.1947 Transcript_988/m.1947 type:complete len:296 (-) Transcript_988:33-920(-)
MGINYYKMDDMNGAMRSYVQALQVQRCYLGDEHPDTAATLHNIGIVHFKTGDYDEAFNCYSWAIRIIREGMEKDPPYDKINPEDNITYAAMLSSIGVIHSKRKKHVVALRCFHQALEIQKSIFGEEHSEITKCYNNIGNAHFETSEFEEALKYYKLSADIQNHLKLKGSEGMTQTSLNIARVYAQQEKYLESIKMYKEVLKQQKADLGENHDAIGKTLKSMSIIYNKLGNLDNAVEADVESTHILMNENISNEWFGMFVNTSASKNEKDDIDTTRQKTFEFDDFPSILYEFQTPF